MRLQKWPDDIIAVCLAPCSQLASVYLSCHPGKSGLQGVAVCACVRVSLMKCWNNNSAGAGRRCNTETQVSLSGKALCCNLVIMQIQMEAAGRVFDCETLCFVTSCVKRKKTHNA